MNQPANDKPKKSLLSLSIDLCGSTQTKQAIVSSSHGDAEYRRDLYELFLRQLSNVESWFLEHVSHQPELRLGSLFLVKSMGDEFWYVYDVDIDDKDELRRVAAGLMRAVQATLSMSVSISFPSRRLTPQEEREPPEDVTLTALDLPLKACIDLFEEPIELSSKRHQLLGSRLQPLAKSPEELAEIYNRLNLGASVLEGTKIKSMVRTDYVGLEVDRFFRICKFCKPRVLVVGDTLLNALDHEIQPIDEMFSYMNIKVLWHRVPHVHAGGYKAERHQIISEELPAHALKGVGSGYKVHYLFTISALGHAGFLPYPGIQDLMEPTRAFLGEHGYYGVERKKLVP